MKTQLILDGLWEYVEEGFKEPQEDEALSIFQMQKLREQRKNDAKTFSKIQLELADSIFPRIINETKTNDAWEILQKEYRGTLKVKPSNLNL